MRKTNVIIPYFQREPGILSRAVKSALNQSGVELQITVVDDGSPVPARRELAPLLQEDNRIVIIEQENAGPGAARNRGLNSTPIDCSQVAFLDSDDVWLPGHLANASQALTSGADFYFADCFYTTHPRHMGGLSRFAQAGLDASAGRRLSANNPFFFFDGDLFEFVLRYSPIHTSAVVAQRTLLQDLRYPTSFRTREDEFFFLTLVRNSRLVAFSNRCEVEIGAGVNIFGSVTWGTPQSLIILRDARRCTKLICDSFQLNEHQRNRNSRRLSTLRRNFVTSFLHLLRKRETIDWRLIFGAFSEDPVMAKSLFSAVWDHLHRPSRRRSSAISDEEHDHDSKNAGRHI